MPLSSAATNSALPLPIRHLPSRKDFSCRAFQMKKALSLHSQKVLTRNMFWNSDVVTNSISNDRDACLGVDVPFPSDYTELLAQAKEATEWALRDNKQLMEIEFPTAGLQSVPGDGEGGTEMTGSMQLIREFCDLFVIPEKAPRTRIFFPEASEVTFARNSAFGGASFKLDYLTKPSLFEDFGFVSKVKMSDRVKPEDELFVVAYPYFNVNDAIPGSGRC